MNNLCNEITKKINLMRIISRKILDASIDEQEEMVNLLVEDYSRISNSLDELIYSQENLDTDELLTLVDKNVKEKYGEESPVSIDFEEYLAFLLRKKAIYETNLQSVNSIAEKIINIEYSIVVDKYKNASASIKDELFDHIENMIMGSIALQETYRGNYESATKLIDPSIYFSDEALSNILNIILRPFLIKNYNSIQFMSLIEKIGNKFGIIKDQENREYIDMVYLHNEVEIAAIYALAKERNIDISLSDYNFNDRTLEKIKEAAEMGEEYLKTHPDNHKKIKIKKK